MNHQEMFHKDLHFFYLTPVNRSENWKHSSQKAFSFWNEKTNLNCILPDYYKDKCGTCANIGISIECFRLGKQINLCWFTTKLSQKIKKIRQAPKIQYLKNFIYLTISLWTPVKFKSGGCIYSTNRVLI